MTRLKTIMMCCSASTVLSGSELPDIVIAEQKEPAYLIMSSFRDWKDPSAKLWSWSPVSDERLSKLVCSSDPEKRMCGELFRDPSDVKPVLNGTHLLVTASYGGAALIRIADKHLVWHVYPANNPHSAELLPDGNVVTASSDGNYLKLFHLAKYRPGDPGATPFQQYFADDAHGVVWDAKRQRLWSSGRFGIVEWKYHPDGRAPSLEQVAIHPLADPRSQNAYQRVNGHDLYPAAGSDQLFFTTAENTYLFDPETRTYSLFQALRSIKSIGISKAPPEGMLLMMKPTEKWWSSSPLFPGNDSLSRQCTLPGARIYKARWMPSSHRPSSKKDSISDSVAGTGSR